MGEITGLMVRPAVGLNADKTIAMNFAMGVSIRPGKKEANGWWHRQRASIPSYISYAKFSSDWALLGIETGFHLPLTPWFSADLTTKIGAIFPLKPTTQKTTLGVMPTLTLSTAQDIIGIQISTMGFSNNPEISRWSLQVTVGVNLMHLTDLIGGNQENR